MMMTRQDYEARLRAIEEGLQRLRYQKANAYVRIENLNSEESRKVMLEAAQDQALTQEDMHALRLRKRDDYIRARRALQDKRMALIAAWRAQRDGTDPGAAASMTRQEYMERRQEIDDELWQLREREIQRREQDNNFDCGQHHWCLYNASNQRSAVIAKKFDRRKEITEFFRSARRKLLDEREQLVAEWRTQFQSPEIPFDDDKISPAEVRQSREDVQAADAD